MKYNKLTNIDDGKYLISNNNIAAISLIDSEQLIMFKLYDWDNKDNVRKFMYKMGYNEDQIDYKINKFEEKLIKEGWNRTHIPAHNALKLQLIYLDVTSNCNYKCVYCYQGTEKVDNSNKYAFLKLDNLKIILKKIKEISPKCKIVVAGGEPFLHKDIFKILDYIEKYGFKFTILTNGSLINNDYSLRLSKFKNLIDVQISVDGINPTTHNLTRGKTFNLTMSGINQIIKYKVPFSLAPTIHSDNLDEIYEIARFAFLNGGRFSPNILRKFPHCPADGFDFNYDILSDFLKSIERKAIKEFGKEIFYKEYQQPIVSNQPNINQFICGTGYSLINIDWNGDVYPCHLLKNKEVKLGNIIKDEFDDIFEKSYRLGIRKMSHEIEKCKECDFMTTCRGGCKAAAYYKYGDFNREDSICNALYEHQKNLYLDMSKSIK